MRETTTAAAPRPLLRFFDEILLYSGQYALFYVLMAFTDQRFLFFADLGHASLLLSLIVQTIVLVIWGKKPAVRFFGSLITPAIYAAFELRTISAFFLDMAHFGFWFFCLLIAALQAFALRARKAQTRFVLEFFSTFFSVIIFLFIYFYFDIRVTHEQLVAAGTLSASALATHLRVSALGANLAEFLADATHVYVVIGGFIMALALARGRVKILRLSERINALFGTYVDGRVRDRIVGATGKLGETKDVAVLFSDIRSFTTITERSEASVVVEMLNRYFSEWDTVSRAHGGIIDKYIGDAIMIIFEPHAGGDPARDAVRCAREMLAGMPRLVADLAESGLPLLPGIGVGIAYGPVILGTIGSASRRNYTAIGDTVNVASRLESACKEFGRTLIVSDSTYERLDPELAGQLTLLGNIPLKGKTDRFSVYGS
jgi:class 3 adenylate cyclase